MKKSDIHDHPRTATLRITKLHFILVGIYVLQTVVYHASKLITPEVLLWRWYAAAGLLAVSVLVWLYAKNWQHSASAYKWAIGVIIAADLAFAAFNVYIQRGYASKSVLLFLVPIIVSAALMSRAALLTTALLAAIIYSTVAVSYFVLNFNEGYMTELYGEIGFYSALFLLTAGLLWNTVHKHNQ